MAQPLLQIFIRGVDEIRLSFRGAGKRSAISRAKTMRRILFRLDAAAQKHIGKKFERRTGNLARLQTEVRTSGETITGLLGPVVAYGLIHEIGGTIRPKKAKYLAIPSDRVKTAAGVQRASPRDFANTFFHRRGDRLFLLQKTGASSVQLLFTLVKKVKIPKRPYLAPALRQTEKYIVDEIGDDYISSLQKGT